MADARVVDEVNGVEELAGVLLAGEHVGEVGEEFLRELSDGLLDLGIVPVWMDISEGVALVVPVGLRGVDVVGEVETVVRDVLEDRGNLRTPDDPPERAPVLRGAVVSPAEAPCAAVAGGHGELQRIRRVEERVSPDAAEALVLVVPDDDVADVLRVARFRPFEPGMGGRYHFHAGDPRLASDAEALLPEDGPEIAVEMQVFGQRFTCECRCIPAVEPVLYLRVAYPLARDFAAFVPRPIQVQALTEYESPLAVEHPGREVVRSEDVPQGCRQRVCRAPRHHKGAGGLLREIVPVVLRIAVHGHGEIVPSAVAEGVYASVVKVGGIRMLAELSYLTHISMTSLLYVISSGCQKRLASIVSKLM